MDCHWIQSSQSLWRCNVRRAVTGSWLTWAWPLGSIYWLDSHLLKSKQNLKLNPSIVSLSKDSKKIQQSSQRSRYELKYIDILDMPSSSFYTYILYIITFVSIFISPKEFFDRYLRPECVTDNSIKSPELWKRNKT